MRSGCLNRSAVLRNPSLNSWGSISAWEFLWFSFNSFADWNSKDFFIDSEIELQVVKHFFYRLIIGSMSSMPFLPQKFSSSDERSWVFKLPSYDIGPLIEFQRQISVTCNPFCVGRIHDSLTSWSDSNWLR
jgi:hypothetical protein